MKTTKFGSSLSDYKVEGQLGRGASAFVYKVSCRNTSQIYALKVIDKDKLKKDNLYSRLRSEISVHIQLKCPYIIELLHYFEDEANVYLLLEYCDGKELYQDLKQQQNGKKGFQENEVVHIFKQIAEGVNYMQSKGVIHRDLKLANILITPKKEIKIIDFGLAVQLSDQNEERQTLCGTPNYISPEVISNQPYGIRADLWSLGCILFALLTGTPPFECSNVQDTLMKAQRGKFELPYQISTEAKDLIKKLLMTDPTKRMGIEDVLEHQFLRTQDENQEQNSMVDQLQKQKELEAALGFETLNVDKENIQENQIMNNKVQQTPGFQQQSLLQSKQKERVEEKKVPKKKRKNSVSKQLEFSKDEKPKKGTRNNFDQIKQRIDQKISSIQSSVQSSESSNSTETQIEQFKLPPTTNMPVIKPVQAPQKYSAKPQVEEYKQKNCEELKLINTARLAPIKHLNKERGGYSKINKNGQVVILLPKNNKKLYISPSGETIIVKSLHLKNYEIEYKFERLPSKLKPWYKYASEFVNVIKKLTPKVILINDTLKCSLMENEPLPNIEVEFSTNLVHNQHQQVKIIYQLGSNRMELQVQQKGRQLQRFEVDPFQDFEHLDKEMQYYIDQAQGAIQVCNEVQIEISQKAEQNIKFPVIIDKRTEKQQ